jgi:hypothetical protein
MTRYLVLLRGINVGGRNKVPMAALRELLESHGHTEVFTYIARGNVILSSDQSAVTIKRELEEGLPKTFQLDSELIAVTGSPRRRPGFPGPAPNVRGSDGTGWKVHSLSIAPYRSARRHPPSQPGGWPTRANPG